MLQFSRFIAIIVRFWRAGRPVETRTRTPFRVRLPDIDTYWHMTNARYLSMMDLARMDLMIRSRWMHYFRQESIKPVNVEVNIAWRRELRPRTRYVIESTVVGVQARKVLVQQRFLVGSTLHAEATVGMLMLKNGTVATSEEVADMIKKVGLLAEATEPLAEAS